MSSTIELSGLILTGMLGNPNLVGQNFSEADMARLVHLSQVGALQMLQMQQDTARSNVASIQAQAAQHHKPAPVVTAPQPQPEPAPAPTTQIPAAPPTVPTLSEDARSFAEQTSVMTGANPPEVAPFKIEYWRDIMIEKTKALASNYSQQLVDDWSDEMRKTFPNFIEDTQNNNLHAGYPPEFHEVIAKYKELVTPIKQAVKMAMAANQYQGNPPAAPNFGNPPAAPNFQSVNG